MVELTLSEKRIKGLTAFQIKVIALVIMTLDHIGAFAFEIPIVAQYEGYLRRIGRLAAPLFLFLLVQSIRHTRNKPKFILWLYLAGMCVELFVTVMNFLIGETFSYFTPENIIFTFFYIALYAVLFERIIDAWKKKDVQILVSSALFLMLSLIPTLLSLFDVFHHVCVAISPNPSTRTIFLINGLWNSLLPSFNSIDYGIGLVILGLIMYFAKTKGKQCAAFLIFCLVCFVGSIVAPGKLFELQSFGFFMTFFNRFQCQMVFALPIMLLYNGEPGRKCKWFFYGYYPLHRELIYLIGELFAG